MVTPEEATRSIEARRPDLRPVAVSHLGRGWDHDVYLANGEWVVRFPRNDAATRAMRVEEDLLPTIATSLPLAIPVPAWGAPDHIAHRLIPGTTVGEAHLDAAARTALAPDLGRFFRALHRLDPAQVPVRLPLDRIGRLSPGVRLAQTLRDLPTAGLSKPVATAAIRILQSFPSGPPESPRVIVHADPHGRNLLVNAAGELTGIIDWVDVLLGHRALDLAVIYEVLPPLGRAAFLEAYGEIDPLNLAWARWRAIDHLLRSLVGARARGLTAFAAECERSLTEAVSD